MVLHTKIIKQHKANTSKGFSLPLCFKLYHATSNKICSKLLKIKTIKSLTKNEPIIMAAYFKPCTAYPYGVQLYLSHFTT